MGMTWGTQSGYLTNNQLDKMIQYAAQPLMRFRQFVSLKEAFGAQKGQSVNWLRVANLGTIGGKLVETSTMNESSQALSWGTMTVDEYGNSIPFTGKIESLSEFDIKEIIKQGLMDDMVKAIDGEVERQFNQTQLRYVGTSATGYALTTNGTATATNTSVLNKYHFKNMVDELTNRNVPGWDKADGDYVLIGGPLALRGIRDDLESINQYTALGVEKVWNREIGRYYGCRVVEDTFASRYLYNSTNRTATLKTWPAAALSMDAYMFGPGTVREAVVEPEHIRIKIPTDYGRSKGIGWYLLGGWKIDREDEPNARIIKWDSAGAA
jgi:N4-gp56 family major capsid protein